MFRKNKLKNISSADIQDFTEQEIGFCVSDKNPHKNKIIDTINEIIEEVGTVKISQLIYYHMNKLNDVNCKHPLVIPHNNFTGTPLEIYTSVGAPPFDYVEGNNIVCGVEIDLLKLVALKLKMPIKTHTVPFNKVFKNINIRTNDWVVSGIGTSINEEREKEHAHLYSLPFWRLNLSYISNNNQSSITSNDLSNKKIGVCESEVGHLFIKTQIEKGVIKNTNLVTYDTPIEAFKDYIKGKNDGIVVVDYVANSLLKQYGRK